MTPEAPGDSGARVTSGTSGAPRVPAGDRPVARVVLGGAGVAVIGVGVIGMTTELGPAQLLGLLGWLVAALALHDGVVAPLTHAVGRPLRRITGTWRPAATWVLRAGLVVGAVLTLPVPALLRAQRTRPGPSLLPGDYLAALGGVWLGLALVVTVVVLGIEVRGRRRERRHPHPHQDR